MSRYFYMRSIIAFLLILIPTGIYSQIRIINESLQDSSSNILYRSVSNRLKIVPENKLEEYHMMINGVGGSVWMVNKNEYTFFITTEGVCHLEIWNNGKQVYSKEYKILRLSDPSVSLGGFKDTTASVNQLLLNPNLLVNHPGCSYRSDLTVISFSCTPAADEDYGSIDTQGNRLSAEQVKIIKTLKKGDRIFFDKIRATCPDCRTRLLVPFAITIK